MFKYIEESQITILDRHIVNISKISLDANIISDGASTKFIMLSSGTISFQNSDRITGCLAAAVNNSVTLRGHGIVINSPGNHLTEESIIKVTAAIPGNLSYIDGCSNSNLVHPARNGDPCLNYLYFPSGINQTFHTHPSYRIGIVLSGSGTAETTGDKYALTTGTMFLLERHTVHRFFTTNSHMSLMVFHPDSEDGPRDEFNPMKSRTYIR